MTTTHKTKQNKKPFRSAYNPQARRIYPSARPQLFHSQESNGYQCSSQGHRGPLAVTEGRMAIRVSFWLIMNVLQRNSIQYSELRARWRREVATRGCDKRLRGGNGED